MVVNCPIFRQVLWYKVENVNLKMIDFDIKVVIDNDIETILGYSNIKLYVVVSITTTRSF